MLDAVVLFQLSNNVVRVEYLDGSELNIVQSTPVILGYHTDSRRKVVEFGKARNGQLPTEVQDKLANFPRIARELEKVTAQAEDIRHQAKVPAGVLVSR